MPGDRELPFKPIKVSSIPLISLVSDLLDPISTPSSEEESKAIELVRVEKSEEAEESDALEKSSSNNQIISLIKSEQKDHERVRKEVPESDSDDQSIELLKVEKKTEDVDSIELLKIERIPIGPLTKKQYIIRKCSRNVKGSKNFDDLLGMLNVQKPLIRKRRTQQSDLKLPEVEVELEGEELERFNRLNDEGAPILTRSARKKVQRKSYAHSDSDIDDDGKDSSDGIYKPSPTLNHLKANGEKRGRGRPRKYPIKPTPEIRRPRGRPRKVVNELSTPQKTTDDNFSPMEQLVKIDHETKSSQVLKKRKVKQEVIPGLITEFPNNDDNDEEFSETETNFVFLNQGELPRVKLPRDLKKAVKQRVIAADVFSSPQKQRVGVLQLPSAVPSSPSKKGIISQLNSSPSKTPNGRAGSPRKLKRQSLQDQSARKRANRTLYSRLLQDGVNDGSDDEANAEIAQKIISESRVGTSADSPFSTPKKLKAYQLPTNDPTFVATPLPTNEENEAFFDGKYLNSALFLDGPDGYFDQHRIKPKLSSNSMVQAPSLNYDQFNSLILFSGYFHSQQKHALTYKYQKGYMQWLFELQEGFNLVFYGVGSKRKFLLSFVEDFLLNYIDAPTIVVNGYNAALSFKEILVQISTTLKLTKVPKKFNDAVEYIAESFKNTPKGSKLILLVHNIDGEQLRDEKIQSYLSRLASIEQFHVIASIDHINAPLLWDSVSLSNYNFVWHNVTNYAEYITETSFHDPLSLGQTQSSSGSKGAKFVLSSLTNSSRSLYRVLASNQLSNMEDEMSARRDTATAVSTKGSIKHGLEFNHFFHLCAEEFISSNEINFRTMLMEFVEHKMAVLTKDASGTELVFIPFTLEEITKLLEDELL